MSADRGILDTNVVIRLRLLDESNLPTQSEITAVTLAELAVGPLMANDDTERVERQRHLQDAELNFAPPLPFDGAAARAFAQVAAAMRRQGRKVSARSFDAMIAAIAIATGLPLYTLDPDDYANIDGLQVMAVPPPASR